METATRKNSNSDSLAAGLTPVVDRVASSAHDAVDKAANAANAAAKTIGKKGDELNKLQARYLDGARDRVRDNPLAAIGVAAGVALAAGLILSFLLGRR
jgi:ElaB/YqjD/DUF883 family membrane-anchored ribosome-binding protein